MIRMRSDAGMQNTPADISNWCHKIPRGYPGKILNCPPGRGWKILYE
jgi:hypothetical protein